MSAPRQNCRYREYIQTMIFDGKIHLWRAEKKGGGGGRNVSNLGYQQTSGRSPRQSLQHSPWFLTDHLDYPSLSLKTNGRIRTKIVGVPMTRLLMIAFGQILSIVSSFTRFRVSPITWGLRTKVSNFHCVPLAHMCSRDNLTPGVSQMPLLKGGGITFRGLGPIALATLAA